MKFDGAGRPMTAAGIARACDYIGVSRADLWAVLAVETRGFGYLRNRRPQILFERHHFSRLTNRRYDATSPDVSSRIRGGYLSGAAEYVRLEKAMELDPTAALLSTSWGIGQIMGANYSLAGFATVDGFVQAMVTDEDAQLAAIARFIGAANMARALRTHDWASFASRYNGKSYASNSYDTRLAATYAKFSVALPDISLRVAQVALVYLGYDPGPVDGQRGRLTRSALVQFQHDTGLTETGALNNQTRSLLVGRAFS